MMKKLYAFAFVALVVPNLSSAKVNVDIIEDAINEGKFGKVKALLRKFEATEMSLKQKNHFYGNFYDTAALAVDERKDRVSPFRNWRDAAKWTGGSFLTLGGCAAWAAGFTFYNSGMPVEKKLLCNAGRFGGVLLTGVGLFLAYKGFMCSTQEKLVAEAQEIEDYIDIRAKEIEALEVKTTES